MDDQTLQQIRERLKSRHEPFPNPFDDFRDRPEPELRHRTMSDELRERGLRQSDFL